MWKQKYRLRPYLQHSTEAEVADRLRYVIENITILTMDGKVGALPPEPHGKFWQELLEHALEEYRRRGIQPPRDFLKNAQIPNPAHPVSVAALKAVRGARLPPEGKYLVKLGQREHISKFYESGILRIAPAGTYDDPSLDAAVRDDELSLSSFGQQNEVLIEVFDPKTGALKHATKPIGNLKYTSQSKTDYYVFCMGKKLDPRLFGDFGYDACLIVHDHIEFERRLSQAMAAHLPEWIGAGGPVRYVDPFNCTKDEMNVLMGKHLKYSYQHEYRCVWLPKNPGVGILEPLFIGIGSMRDISEMVVLE